MIDPQNVKTFHEQQNETLALIAEIESAGWLFRPIGMLRLRTLRKLAGLYGVLSDMLDINLGLDKPTGRAMAPRDVGGDPIDLTEEMARHAQLRELICPHPECSYNEGEGDRTLCGDTQCPYRPENFARQHAAE